SISSASTSPVRQRAARFASVLSTTITSLDGKQGLSVAGLENLRSGVAPAAWRMGRPASDAPPLCVSPAKSGRYVREVGHASALGRGPEYAARTRRRLPRQAATA